MLKSQKQNSTFANIDMFILILYFTLVIMGWINIYAAVYNEEHQSIFSISQQYGKQLIWIIAAFFLGILFLLLDSKFIPLFSYPVYGFIILLLISVLLFGREVNGARSWFELGGLRLQPAEFAKLATCMALSKYLSSYNVRMTKLKTLLIIGAFLIVPFALILLQNDTGSALVYIAFMFVFYRFGMSGVILFLGFYSAVLFVLTLIFEPFYVAVSVLVFAFLLFYLIRRNSKELLVGILLFAVSFLLIWFLFTRILHKESNFLILIISVVLSGIPILIYAYKRRVASIFYMLVFAIGFIFLTISVDFIFNKVLEKHQRTRINVLLGLESDPKGAGYNVNQSLIAIGSGGFSGKGFLQGTQTKFDFVPEQSTDFIFCTVGEEWGFIGTTVVVLLFLTLILRIIQLSEKQKSLYSRIYGYSVASIIFFHVAINVGMTIGIAPVIGIPLPFFSYGGSSLWTFTVLIAIFLRLDAERDRMIQ